MAKVKLNPILEQIRGQVGDLVFRRYGDGVVLSQKPDRTGAAPSAAQLAHRERFRQAAFYGRTVMADPEARALYTEAARQRRQPVYSLTLADFFHAPTVDEVDVSAYGGGTGDPVAIRATDDFAVHRVEVTLADGAGAVLEAGEAVLDGWRWVYTAQTDVVPGTTVRIDVRAFDRPGGVGEETVEVTVSA